MTLPLPKASLRWLLIVLPIAAAWVFVFRDEFPLLYAQLNTEDFSYCFLVPLVAVYFAWQNRERIAADIGGPTWPGYLGLCCAGGLLVIGRIGSLETLIFLAMWLSVASITFALLGLRTLPQLSFSLLVLLFTLPPPQFVEQVMSFNLRLMSSSLASQILELLSVPVFQEGNIIDLGSIRLQVVDACSGLRYFLPTLFMSLLVGKFFNRRPLARILLFLSSAPISIGFNAIRITMTGILVRYVSPSLAEGFFHDFQGWVTYLITLVLLFGVSMGLKIIEKQPEPAKQPEPQAAPEAPAPHASEAAAPQISEPIKDAPAASPLPTPGLLPGLALTALLLAIALALGSITSAQVVPKWRSLSEFPMAIGEWEGLRIQLDQETLAGLGCDDYVMATFRHRTSLQTLHLLIPYYKTQTAQHTAHAPTSCMLGSGWEILSKLRLEPDPGTRRDFPVKQIVLSKGGTLLLSNFWFQQRGRIIENEFSNKLYLLLDALTKRRTDGALVRVEMVLPNGMSPDQGQLELDTFTIQVRSLLRDFLPE